MSRIKTHISHFEVTFSIHFVLLGSPQRGQTLEYKGRGILSGLEGATSFEESVIKILTFLLWIRGASRRFVRP